MPVKIVKLLMCGVCAFRLSLWEDLSIIEVDRKANMKKSNILTAAALLLLAAIISVLVFSSGIDLNKDIPVPEMTDDEVLGLLKALRLPDGTDISAMRVVFSKDGAGGSIRIRARVRINQSQFEEVFPESWMKSHQVTASKFHLPQMTVPPQYEFDWWEALPLRPGDEQFDMSLDEPPYNNFIMGIARKSGTDVDLYFVSCSHSDYLPPIVFTTMRRGRSPTHAFPSQVQFYEIKKGDFQEGGN